MAGKKTADEIAEGILAAINRNPLEVMFVFRGLRKERRDIRFAILRSLEDNMINEARQMGRMWRQSGPEAAARIYGERIRTVTRALQQISKMRGYPAQSFTRYAAHDGLMLAPLDKKYLQNLAGCFNAVSVRASKEAAAAAHRVSAERQQKLGKLGAGRKVRIAGKTP